MALTFGVSKLATIVCQPSHKRTCDRLGRTLFPCYPMAAPFGRDGGQDALLPKRNPVAGDLDQEFILGER